MKTLPQAVDLEEIVLGSIILDQDVLVRYIDQLKEEDFYKPQNQTIFRHVLLVYNNQNPVDLMTVMNSIKSSNDLKKAGGASHLTSLYNNSYCNNIEEYVRIIKSKSKLRALLQASYNINKLVTEDEEQDIDTVLDIAEKEIFQIAKETIDNKNISVSDTLEKAIEKINNRTAYNGVPTGFDCLDNLLGGLQKSDMIVIGARPSVGKTSLSLEIARRSAIKTKEPVAIFSLEMSEEQIVDRFLSVQSDIDLWQIRNSKLRNENFADIEEAIETINDMQIYIDDSPNLTMLKIRTKARRLLAEKGLSLIIIDYLQLITPTLHTNNSVQQFSDISRQIKGLARELNVPVLVLSQLSRNVEQRGISAKPKLSDLRETGSIEQDSDVVILLSKKEHIMTPEDESIKVAVNIAKHRNGPIGERELTFIKETTSFVDINNF